MSCQVCRIKYAENEISDTTSHKKKERERGAKIYTTSKTSILKLLKSCHLLH